MNCGDIINGRWIITDLVAVQGPADCTDRRCTRGIQYNGTSEEGISICIGMHCPHCGEPCGTYGHKACRDGLA